MTRQAKTPRQRAEEALAVAERQVERLTQQWTKARDEFERLRDEHAAAIARRDHLRGHPDLRNTPTSTNQAGADA